MCFKIHEGNPYLLVLEVFHSLETILILLMMILHLSNKAREWTQKYGDVFYTKIGGADYV
jgi:hypothetical protein